MDKHPSKVSEMFDRISPQYDKANRILSLGLDMRWRRKLADYLPKSSDLTLLDLATGTGDQLVALLERGAPIKKAVGLDFSEGMLQVAKRKFAKNRLISLIHGDAEALPFETASFDATTFSFGIRNVQHPHKALNEMHRVLRSGGTCLILEFSLPDNLFRKPYLFYLRRLLPLLGGLIARDFAAYRYLNRTIEGFASGEAFLSWMRQSGFVELRATPLLFGSVTLYSGKKA